LPGKNICRGGEIGIKDATHMWLCRGEGADQIWKSRMAGLETWMTSMKTDPDIIEIVIKELHNWHGMTIDTQVPSSLLQACYSIQRDVDGNRYLRDGFILSGNSGSRNFMSILDQNIRRNDGPMKTQGPSTGKLENFPLMHAQYFSTPRKYTYFGLQQCRKASTLKEGMGQNKEHCIACL
jgi:hypothetical protein